MVMVLCFSEMSVHIHEATRRHNPKFKFYSEIIAKFFIVSDFFLVTFSLPSLFEP
jgi:hypothetical protein